MTTAQVIIVILVGVAVVVAVAAWVVRTRGGSEAAARDAERAGVRTRPPVAEFHVRGEEAQVYFDVPLPEGEADEVLQKLLVHEAVEVVREKRHSLPITEARRVVAFGKAGGAWARAGQVKLATPGELPPPSAPPALLHAAIPDPLGTQFATELPSRAPGLAEVRREDQLGPAGGDVRLPAVLETGLRTQGIDPPHASAGGLVLGILALSGYTVTPGERADTYFAGRGATRTYIQVDDIREGDHPELAEGTIDRFMIAFGSSGADRGLLISDKYGPFRVYEKERREPRVRFVTRERLQHFVDSLALG